MSASLHSAIGYVRRAGEGLARGLNSPGPSIDPGELTPDSVSTGAGLMQLATALASGFRARANYRAQREQDERKGRFVDAQTRLMEAKLSAAPKQQYSLTTPSRTEELPQGHEGPPLEIPGETISFDDPGEFSREKARWFPPDKQAAGITEFQRESLALRRAALQRLRDRDAGAGASRSRLGALNAASRAVEGESEAGAAQSMTNAQRMAAALAAALAGNRVVDGPDGKRRTEKIPRVDRLRAAMELGVPEKASPQVVAAAAKAWAERKGGAWGQEVRGRSASRIASINRSIFDEAGLDFASDDEAASLIEAIRSLEE
ncbi:MAG: hypothetical protein ACKVW3_01845 [Phycisphaerales bacterium]